MKKLCLLDTNILSDTLNESQSIHQSVYKKLQQGYNFSITFLTLVEVVKWDGLIEKFCEFTNDNKVHVIKPSNQLLKEEVNAYPNSLRKEETVLLTCDPGNILEKKQIDDYLKSQEFYDKAELLKSDQQVAIDNIKKTVATETESNLREFTERYVWTHLSLKYPTFFKQVIDSNNLNKLISLKSLYTEANFLYYRFIHKKGNSELSSAFDALIINCLPYVDLFLTEKTNAAYLRELKPKLDIIGHVGIETMKDLRG